MIEKYIPERIVTFENLDGIVKKCVWCRKDNSIIPIEVCEKGVFRLDVKDIVCRRCLKLERKNISSELRNVEKIVFYPELRKYYEDKKVERVKSKIKRQANLKQNGSRLHGEKSLIGHVIKSNSGKIDIEFLKGSTISEITNKLKISVSRVKSHISHIIEEHSKEVNIKRKDDFITFELLN